VLYPFINKSPHSSQYVDDVDDVADVDVDVDVADVDV
jgi:hypothetical protein